MLSLQTGTSMDLHRTLSLLGSRPPRPAPGAWLFFLPFSDPTLEPVFSDFPAPQIWVSSFSGLLQSLLSILGVLQGLYLQLSLLLESEAPDGSLFLHSS